MKLPDIDNLIIAEDENIIVLNKPPLLTSEHDSSAEGLSLAGYVNKFRPGVMLCHRLDKETSGIILGAKTEEWYRYFSIQFERRKVEKIYHALIAGTKKFEGQEVNFPLAKKGSQKGVVNWREGRPALTKLNSIEFFKHYTLIEARPITGRFHQIRVHLASIGCPIVGDALYGGKPFFLSEVKRGYRTSKFEEELPVLDRTALHARSLKFEYPEGTVKQFEAPYPRDMEVAIKLLRKNDAF